MSELASSDGGVKEPKSSLWISLLHEDNESVLHDGLGAMEEQASCDGGVEEPKRSMWKSLLQEANESDTLDRSTLKKVIQNLNIKGRLLKKSTGVRLIEFFTAAHKSSDGGTQLDSRGSSSLSVDKFSKIYKSKDISNVGGDFQKSGNVHCDPIDSSEISKIKHSPEIIVAVIGDPTTGKSTLLQRHKQGGLPVWLDPTADWYIHDYQTTDGMIRFHCLDVHNFDALDLKNYGFVDAVVILFRVDQRETFDGIITKILNVRRATRDDVPIAICGNMVDKPGERKVEVDMVASARMSRLYESGFVGYWEMCATSNYNVLEPFEWLATRCKGHNVYVDRAVPFNDPDLGTPENPRQPLNIEHQNLVELMMLEMYVRPIP